MFKHTLANIMLNTNVSKICVLHTICGKIASLQSINGMLVDAKID